MNKTLSVISLLLSVMLLFGALSVFGVSADETPEEAETEEVTYEKKEVTAYVFAADSTKTFECFFRSDLPDVPYVEPTDYLGVIYTDAFTAGKNDDGTFVFSNVREETMVIDSEKDTVYFADYDSYVDCTLNDEGSSLNIDYVQVADGSYIVEPDEVTIDLAAYQIDVYEADEKVYLPLTVLGAMFASTYNNALYLDGSIYFVHTFDPESYYDSVDDSSRYQSLTRSRAEADFTYNTLCLFFDYFYGKPSMLILAEMLAEKGFDETLATFDEYTQLARELLLSENRSEYFSGLAIAGYYLYDGGHTVIPNIPIIAVNDYGDQPLAGQWYSDITADTDVADAVWATLNALFGMYGETNELLNVRDEEYKAYEEEIVKDWESGAFLIIHGDTAVFVFDSFVEDTPDEFKDALDVAKEAGVKNFILDDSCNGGGYVAACEYILTMIANAGRKDASFKSWNMNPLTGSIYELVYDIDLNLDGEFTDEDDQVAYDFNFAVLTSHCAFSCGNMLPMHAHDLGVMVIGETSGGGSCVVTERYLADGFAFPISDISKSVLVDGTDFDFGAEVDVDLTVEDGDGYIDYSGFYDIDALGELVEAFYADAPHDHVPGDAVIENATDGICEGPGSYDEVVYCTVCGAELSRETKNTEALGHDWGEWTVTKPATATEKGEETRVCKRDGSHTETRDIPETGHYEPPQAGSGLEILIVLAIAAAAAVIVIVVKKRLRD
ncbi:MAG: hypothetical protein IJU52_02535 [Clostridia bacterium]|nr:hypothetical protein [Clostridia bacterium]